MLIRRTPDTYEKLQLLGGMASDDVLSQPQRKSKERRPYSDPKKNPLPGVYKASMPNGKTISLLRVMFTDFCKMDCHFCPNSHWVPRKRFAFKRDELARTFMELHQRHTVDGLFLSSGVAGTGSKTTAKLIDVVQIIRERYGFKGYIHMKVMPGTERQYVEAAHKLGTRLSVNIETPTAGRMRTLSKMKDLERDILAPMEWINDLNREKTGGAVGQATQFVVGAANESDREIFHRVDQLYGEWNLKRAYYSNFQPVPYTPLEEHPATSMTRSHRLYQMDWLKRIYKFSNEEIELAFDESGHLSMDQDPKTVIAMENLDAFPIDINHSTKEQLLRAPGVGPTSVDRILRQRGQHSIDSWRDLRLMGVNKKRAWPFLVFPGHRPPKAKQLRLDLFREPAPETHPHRHRGRGISTLRRVDRRAAARDARFMGRRGIRGRRARGRQCWPGWGRKSRGHSLHRKK